MYSSDLTAFGKKYCYFFVPFWCLVFDMFWCCTVLDLVISTYFNHVNGAKCLIHINLCTASDLFPFLFSFFFKEKQYKIALILLCPVQGPWASCFYTKDIIWKMTNFPNFFTRYQTFYHMLYQQAYQKSIAKGIFNFHYAHCKWSS